MKLTLITINLNNASGLDKTMGSVLSQSAPDFEYIVIDGASSDSSVSVIEKYAAQFPNRLKWISEPDKGIYNAMNKAIRMANGDYLQFLNSGDSLADEFVVEKMMESLAQHDYPAILYGNTIKVFDDGPKAFKNDCTEVEISFLSFYKGTINHSSALIQRTLFDKYGLYDESLKIVSDWKWFIQTIIFGGEKPVYTDIDVLLFDMHGISEKNKELNFRERNAVLSEMLPSPILKDYEIYSSDIDKMKRLKRHPLAFRIVWFLERCIFKVEKAHNTRK